jgi:hypothetical protein
MKLHSNLKTGLSISGLIGCTVLSASVNAASFNPTGVNLSYGAVSHGQGTISNNLNPASGAYDRTRMTSDDKVMGEFSLGGGLEYGNLDNLFEKIDDLAGYFASKDDGANNGGGDNGGDSGGKPGGDLDISNPDLDALIDRIGVEAASAAAILALVSTDGFARADISNQFSLISNTNFLGGTFSFNFTRQVSSGAIGIEDDFNFDSQQALTELESLFALVPEDPITTFDLSGGISITVEPSTGKASFAFENDSLLVTKAAKVSEFTFGYSREYGDYESGSLYWGVTPKVVNIGLSNVATRIGDIGDSESLFDDIKNAEFNTDTAIDIDLGVLWTASNYSIGASLLDLVQSEFEFPVIDTTQIESEKVLDTLKNIRQYKSKRQLKLESGLYTSDKKWGLNVAVDANAVEDPLGQSFQWASISGGYKSNSWILSNLRAGLHSNLSGTKLSQVAIGITALKYFNLDLASTLETTKISGNSYPKNVKLSLGFNYKF